MSFELLQDMFYAAPELWYGLSAVFVLLLFAVLVVGIKLLKLRQKNYFLNRDRERYAETLYASKDGYFAFIYPDEKVNDPCQMIRERCSRRLAVILNLEKGTNSSFEDVLKTFYKDDAKKLVKYIGLLMDEGVSFEDEFVLKASGKHIKLAGSRISGLDGNVYCDMIWFRDVSFESNKIEELEKEKNEAQKSMQSLQDVIDNLPYPIWLRDENLKKVLINKKYIDFVPDATREEILDKGLEIQNAGGESSARNLALAAQAANKIKKETVSLVKNGKRFSFEAIETPFHAGQSLDKICTVGALVDVTELDDLKRNLKLHQNAHLEILGALGTAFAVFDNKFKLSFYNKAFAAFWKLEDVWLESAPSYSMFLDVIREKRMLPEVPDFRLYKNDEQKDFSVIIEPKEDMLHLPDGRTFRRVRAPHPMGGLVFAFEDVTDRLATRRAYNSLLSVQKEILDNLFNPVLIFGSNGRLIFYNKAYLDMWNADELMLQNEPGIDEIVEAQAEFFSNVDNWKLLKKDIIQHLTSLTTKSFSIKRSDGLSIEVLTAVLSDGSILITYKQL